MRHLHLEELAQAVRTGALPDGAAERGDVRPAAPLPARFRLTVDGSVAPAAPARSRRRARSGSGTSSGGTGAGGGRGMGPAHQGSDPPEPGAVLVVRTLDPDLAPLLPRLGGLVAETGSFLSHLAILAREFGVPTVVGVEDALSRFPAGSLLVVDGGTGDVELVESARGAA